MPFTLDPISASVTVASIGSTALYLDDSGDTSSKVVSMNGTLASEACNAALDLITGYEDSAEALVSPVVERVPFPSTGTQRASTSASSTERIGLPM